MLGWMVILPADPDEITCLTICMFGKLLQIICFDGRRLEGIVVTGQIKSPQLG